MRKIISSSKLFLFNLSYLLLFGVLLLPAACLAQGWYPLNVGISNQVRSSIRFVNENVGYYCTLPSGSQPSGQILKSIDGGLSWTNIWGFTPPSRYYRFYSIKAFNKDTVFVIGSVFIVQSGTYGVFARTTNGGGTWTIQQYSQFFTSLHSDGDSVLYVSGRSGYIGKSTDLGSNWIQLPTNVNEDINDVIFRSDNFGLICGEFGIRKSINSVDWYIVDTNKIDKLSFFNNDIGFAVGMGVILKTTNAGENWNIVISDSKKRSEIYFGSINEGYTIGDSGLIQKSTNGGLSWDTQISTTSNNLTSITFVNGSTGWVSGSSGAVLKTTNGGISKIHQSGGNIPHTHSLHQNYPNPFNPSTKIKFDIPRGSLVKLKIYDMLGREVAELVNEKLNAGVYEYEWNGINLPSGVYFYKLEAENFIETKRMVLVK